MEVYNVLVSIRKGLGPDWMDKKFPVGLDDLPADMSESEKKQNATHQVEHYLYNTIDYQDYGKNWIIKEVTKD